ncbi:methyltransferase domain-containing protein [Actinospica robiniae]|uniref:methyltransferase domain-containing protein n=1 Tax=Actinospica robiniae TaxID=304901 RepID=UPI000420B057|nr:methyltransferase domain-containing protein [Actinospica robiniae]
MSRYDALPLVRRLLRELPGPVDTIVDLGCGDGTILLDLCGDGPSGVGVDPHPPSIAAARRAAAESGLEVSFAVDSAEGYLARGDGLPRGRTAYLTAFSLQEVLEQQDRDAVVQLVHAAVHCAEDSHLVVIEVDHRPDDPSKMRHGLGTAYYNPYYLLHQVTEQRLETTGFWRRLFSDAGTRVEAWMTTDPRVDSTALEFGCLLSRATEAPGGEGGDA